MLYEFIVIRCQKIICWYYIRVQQLFLKHVQILQENPKYYQWSEIHRECTAKYISRSQSLNEWKPASLFKIIFRLAFPRSAIAKFRLRTVRATVPPSRDHFPQPRRHAVRESTIIKSGKSASPLLPYRPPYCLRYSVHVVLRSFRQWNSHPACSRE